MVHRIRYALAEPLGCGADDFLARRLRAATAPAAVAMASTSRRLVIRRSPATPGRESPRCDLVAAGPVGGQGDRRSDLGELPKNESVTAPTLSIITTGRRTNHPMIGKSAANSSAAPPRMVAHQGRRASAGDARPRRRTSRSRSSRCRHRAGRCWRSSTPAHAPASRRGGRAPARPRITTVIGMPASSDAIRLIRIAGRLAARAGPDRPAYEPEALQ